jgi:hypothetical protein
MSNELVDNNDYYDSRKNEHPIGDLSACYRCFLAKPIHGFPPRSAPSVGGLGIIPHFTSYVRSRHELKFFGWGQRKPRA